VSIDEGLSITCFGETIKKSAIKNEILKKSKSSWVEALTMKGKKYAVIP
jgi:hypothetical protein